MNISIPKPYAIYPTKDSSNCLSSTDRSTSIDYWVPFFLISTAVLVLIVSQLAFSLRLPISNWTLPIALTLAGLPILWDGKRKSTPPIETLFILIFNGTILSICALFAGQLTDFSFDGQSYHIPATIALAEGWNPLLEAHLNQWNATFSEKVGTDLYIDHYPTGAWLTAAALYKFTGLLETGKAFNFVFPIALYFLSVRFFNQTKISTRFERHLLSGLIALNPIAICQLSSFYVDGQLASLVSIAILLTLQFNWRKDKEILPILAGTLILLINVKFTGFVYAGVISTVGSLYLVIFKQSFAAYLKTVTLAGFFGIFIVGFHPYVTNTLQHENPFYPIGAEFKNPLTNQMPSAFLEKNRFEKLVYTVFGHQENSAELPELKSPLDITKSDLWAMESSDVSFGAFGPFFAVTVCCTFAIAFFTCTLHRKLNLMLIGLTILIFSTMAPISEMWKGRYAPQFWLLPVGITAAFLNSHFTGGRNFGRAMAALLAANLVIVCYFNLTKNYLKSQDFARKQEELLFNSGSIPLQIYFPSRVITHQQRLKDYGIQYNVANKGECVGGHEIGYPQGVAMNICENLSALSTNWALAK